MKSSRVGTAHGKRKTKSRSTSARPAAAARALARERGTPNFIGRIATVSLDPDQVITAALESLVGTIGADWAAIFLRENGRMHLVEERRRAPDRVRPVVNPQNCARCLCRAAARERKIKIVQHAKRSTRGIPTDCRGAEIGSCAAYPLVSGNQPVGVMALASLEARFFKERGAYLEAAAGEIAIALQNALLHRGMRQREEELRQYTNEQATFYEIALRLNSQSTLPGLLHAIVEQGVGLVHAQAGAVFRFNPGQNLLRLETGVGFAAEYTGSAVAAGQGVVGKVWESRKPLVVNDYAEYADRRIPFAQDGRIQAALAVPLMGSRGPLGVLLVTSGVPDCEFTERDVRLAEMLSVQASLAIENALLYEQEHEHRELAETLGEVGAALTATLDPQLVLDNILAQLARLVPHDAANIMHIEDGVARIVRWRGYERFGAGDLSGFGAEMEEGSLWREMEESGKPIVLAEMKDTPHWDGSPAMAWVRSFLGAPIRVRNQTIGFLNVNSQTANFFTAEHAVRLQALANQAAIALANAELFEKARVAAERLQALSHRLVQTQEMERVRIARELHDEMGQALTAQMVDLHYCEQHVQEPKVVAERLAILKRSTDNVLENLHRLTVDLRPVALDHLGLIPALNQYVQAFCQQHPEIQVQFQVIGMGEERQPTETETALYRITQESLTNIARHAHASRVEVMIARRADKIILMCWDNGVGFDPRGMGPNERMGLTSMRERASMLGGFVWIDSELGVGTTVHVEVPYVGSNSDRG